MFTNSNHHQHLAIGVDLDNVIAQTDKTIRKLIRSRYGIESSQAQIVTWNYHESLPITPEQEREIFADFHAHHLTDPEVVEGARIGMEELHLRGSIWIVTHRPLLSRRDTREWLADHEIVYDELIFVEDKSTLADRFSFLVDDNGNTAIAVAASGTPVFLLDYPWNRFVCDVPHLKRVLSWEEILKIVLPHRPEHKLERVSL